MTTLAVDAFYFLIQFRDPKTFLAHDAFDTFIKLLRQHLKLELGNLERSLSFERFHPFFASKKPPQSVVLPTLRSTDLVQL